MHPQRILALALVTTSFSSLALPSALAAQAAPVRLDDGYTVFELGDHEDSINGARVFQGYHVTSHYRVFGTVPSASAILTIYKEGTREVGRTRCEGSAHRDVSDDPAWVGMTFECADWEQRIRSVGTLTAETYFIDGQTDAQTLLRSHRLQVQEVAQAGGMSPTHYVSRHQEVLSGILAWTPHSTNSYGLHGYFTGYDAPANTNSLVVILPVAGTGETADALTHTRIRCTVNGQPVALTAGDEPTDSRGARYVAASQQVPTGGGGTEQVDMSFRQVVIGLPLTFGADAPSDTVSISRNPGRWQCDMRNNGQSVRTFAFTVGANGLPQEHAEQGAGLYLGPRAVLVDVTVPAAGARLERTAPAEVRAGGFHGRPWTTDAMRAAAAAVPAIGTPHLTAPGPARAAPAAPGAAPAAGRRRRR